MVMHMKIAVPSITSLFELAASSSCEKRYALFKRLLSGNLLGLSFSNEIELQDTPRYPKSPVAVDR